MHLAYKSPKEVGKVQKRLSGKTVKIQKEGYYILIKRSIQQENEMYMLNIFEHIH